MTQEDKIKLLEDLFEEDEGTLTPELELDRLAWDSMAMLALIALISEEFGKRVDGAQMRGFKTVGDILSVME